MLVRLQSPEAFPCFLHGGGVLRHFLFQNTF